MGSALVLANLVVGCVSPQNGRAGRTDHHYPRRHAYPVGVRTT
jgi:hypothetical protein